MSNAGPWTNSDFESMSWHDVHVHGFRFEAFDESEGCADLVLDIDYILRWERLGDGTLFVVSQADLRFQEVFGFKVALDYASPTAGMSPIALDGIEREPLKAPNGHKSYRWRLRVNWPVGSMEFEAPGFIQQLRGVPHVQSGQWLAPEKRNA